MKKLSFTVLTVSCLALAQDFLEIRLLDGIGQIQRSIELAKKAEVDLKNPYHFEKAKANREVSYLFASDLDESGSKVFMIKSFNALSKAMHGKAELDTLSPISKALVKQDYRLELDLETIGSSIRLLRENKALSCAPAELARAEVYYDAMAYELSKPKPKLTILKDFHEKAQIETNRAMEKVKVAKEGNLECYTGKPFVPELARAEAIDKPAYTPPLPSQETKPREEPLMVTARVHFDFNKHQIKREYIPLLNEVAKTLKENPSIMVRIEGFTDHIGPKAYNDKLALKRAQAVREYLIKAGVQAERIEVVGFGKDKYIASNQDAMGRFTNRRTEFIVLQVPGR